MLSVINHTNKPMSSAEPRSDQRVMDVSYAGCCIWTSENAVSAKFAEFIFGELVYCLETADHPGQTRKNRYKPLGYAPKADRHPAGQAVNTAGHNG